jgi:hypothetical protein
MNVDNRSYKFRDAGVKFRLAILFCSALAGFFLVPAAVAHAQVAPKPLFRDPVHDGAADPTLIWNVQRKEWWMFYTNRRADEASDDSHDVSWVHATRIGIAASKDGGVTWSYRGTAEIPYGEADYTHWAPDIKWWKGSYQMFLTIVPGTFKDWNAPREIIYLQSRDLLHWKFVSKLELGSDRVIDPALFQMDDGTWRIWYKDERDHSAIHYADSKDLKDWTPRGTAISDRPGEGPKVFQWRENYWMITDVWKGLGVYRSSDLLHWTPQADNLLRKPGKLATDRNEGHHCDVVVNGDRAFIFYFTHQVGLDKDPRLKHSEARTVLQVAELHEEGGILTTYRDAPVHVSLGKP